MLWNPRPHACIGLTFETLIACLRMLKDHFCPIFWFDGVSGNTCAFEMAHFWINVFRADDFLMMFASGLEFKIHKIVRKLMIRIVCPMIVIQLSLLL